MSEKKQIKVNNTTIYVYEQSIRIGDHVIYFNDINDAAWRIHDVMKEEYEKGRKSLKQDIVNLLK